MPGLSTIPRELRIKIAEYLTMNCDKKSICLVCKEMAIVGTPLLYQNMVIHADRLDDNLVPETSVPGRHHGLSHVRTLRIDSKDSYQHYKHPHISSKTSALCSLLQATPRNVLVRFDLITSGRVSEVISYILSQQQHRLTNYQYHTHHGIPPPTRTTPNADVLACITSVRLHIRCEDDCRRAASIIACNPNITELSIHLVGRSAFRTPKFKAEWCKNFVNALFCVNGILSQFLHLKSLTLVDFRLALLGPVLSQSVDFSKLEELRLVRCKDVGAMLLSLGLQQVGWKTLRVEEEAACDDSGELKTFVQTMTAPETLTISRERWYAEGEDAGKLCWKNLVPHSSTLKSLRLNIDEPCGYDLNGRCEISVADFRELCKSASKLVQLALTCPSIEDDQWQGEHGFAAFLDCLTSITTLKTLELHTFPACLDRSFVPPCTCGCNCCPFDDMEELSDATVDRVFTKAANEVFRVLAPSCPGFTALLFRVPELEDANSSDHLFAFVVSSKTDECGRTTHGAVSVEPHLLKHYEPRSDILDLEYREIITNVEAGARNACQYSGNRSWF